MKIAKIFLAGLAASAAMLAFEGDSFANKFEGLPQAVKETARAQMDNALPVSISSAQGEHGWNYQINTRLDGKYHDIVIDEKGGLVAVKDEIDLASIPSAARAAIEKRSATSKIVTVEKVTEGGAVSYGAVLPDGAQVRVAADGTPKSKSESGK